MKALVYTGVKTLEYQTVDDPVVDDGCALVEVEAVGICGSDMHAWAGHDARRPAPLILGHEAAGTVRGGALDGQRVTVNPLVTCGQCEWSLRGQDNLCEARQIISMPPREGAFAEQVAMPIGNLVVVPDHVSSERAALAEPIACGWHAVDRAIGALQQDHTQTRALVLGGGAIGLGAALCLRARGVPEVVVAETNPLRHPAVASAGFTVVDPREENLDNGFQLIIDGVGYAATRATATAAARPGGVIAHIGLGEATDGLDIRRMTLHEITFIGTYTYTMADFRATCAALFAGELGKLDWTEQRALADGGQACDDIAAGVVAAPKIVLRP
ncbi:MAG: alcohol dehydrogenase catalytic domain-containing protein [Pseudomonadota bacterium]